MNDWAMDISLRRRWKNQFEEKVVFCVHESWYELLSEKCLGVDTIVMDNGNIKQTVANWTFNKYKKCITILEDNVKEKSRF